MSSPTIGLLSLPHHAGLPFPRQMTELAAGADLVAALTEPVTIAPLQRILIPTGLIFEIPAGFEVQIRPRSGLAAKHGITVLNTPGTIDADYRGEVQVILVNLSAEPFVVNRGERIAQAVVAPVVSALWSEVKTVSETTRGSGGFGHTGRG